MRTDPNEILRQLRHEERTRSRGVLKIFFGYAAGVGKTYAMLKAAQAAKVRGLDVVAGYVEPHPRPETAALLEGLERIPSVAIEHKGITLQEFDLDATIARAPRLALVDELAHTNAPGSRHLKRYQDVQELLKAGIDVYTTINVQHIESLNDMVAAITGVSVRERIPDSVFDDADLVELVDIEPQDLIERLKTGKIYRETQARQALGNFFDVKNLTALREIALRRCADRMSKLSERIVAQRSDYYTDEHILVCLSSSPTNAKLIRTAARMTAAFKGTMTALFVETSSFSSMSEENKNRLRENIRLAEQLGASIETVNGDDIPLQIAEFARISGVSKIVVGRSSARRRFFWSGANFTERLTNAAPNLDIYVIPDRSTPRYRPAVAAQGSFGHFQSSDVAWSVLFLVLATCVGFLFERLGFSEANIITVYILSVLMTAVVTTQRGYSLVSSVVSVLIFNYFFTAPRYTLSAYDAGYPATFLIMFIAAFLTSSLAVRLKQQARRAAGTAYRTRILLETDQLLQKGKNREEIVAIIAGQLTKLLQRDVAFYLAEGQFLSKPMVYTVGGREDTGLYTGENETAVASWVYKNNKHAGATTDTLGNARCLYLAVRVNETVYGVVGVAIQEDPLEPVENSIMLSILGECALALESDTAHREREEAAILAKNEQLRADLLRSISHDLRTPLTSISGNAGILLSSEEAIEPSRRRQIYADIYDDSLWLINLVENLLSVTRIEDGTMSLHLTAELMDEIITEAMRHISRRRNEHAIILRQPEELLLAKVDARLIVQVLINIVDNAIKYTPKDSEIVLSVSREGSFVVVEVSDNGPGIPDLIKEKVFDMFYTANKEVADSRRSLGLGLSLCKSIITAHGGTISVRDNHPAGTVFRFTLPAEEVAIHE